MGDTENGSWGSRELGGYLRREEVRKMICSGCNVPIAPHTKYLCVYPLENGFALQVGCDHFTPPPGWQYIFGASQCFDDWIAKFQEGLRICKHNGDL